MLIAAFPVVTPKMRHFQMFPGRQNLSPLQTTTDLGSFPPGKQISDLMSSTDCGHVTLSFQLLPNIMAEIIDLCSIATTRVKRDHELDLCANQEWRGYE